MNPKPGMATADSDAQSKEDPSPVAKQGAVPWRASLGLGFRVWLWGLGFRV